MLLTINNKSYECCEVPNHALYRPLLYITSPGVYKWYASSSRKSMRDFVLLAGRMSRWMPLQFSNSGSPRCNDDSHQVSVQSKIWLNRCPAIILHFYFDCVFFSPKLFFSKCLFMNISKGYQQSADNNSQRNILHFPVVFIFIKTYSNLDLIFYSCLIFLPSKWSLVAMAFTPLSRRQMAPSSLSCVTVPWHIVPTGSFPSTEIYIEPQDKSVYSKCSKISNTLLFLFSNKMLAFRAGIHKMLVRIANRRDPDQTAS